MTEIVRSGSSKMFNDEQGDLNGTLSCTSLEGAVQVQSHHSEFELDMANLTFAFEIGRGSSGSVYQARYDGQRVAVKVLELGQDGQRTNAFHKEVSVWSKLDHPNIVKFIGAIRDDDMCLQKGMQLMVAEYISGGTLKSYLIRNMKTKLSLEKVIQLSLDLAKGLRYLHSEKVIHRDVKTENMLLDNGKVKIADFGVARLESLEKSEMTGQTGTLGYMAPEVLEGKPYDSKSDVYSFGICLWEIYCCDMPYPLDKFADVSSAIVNKGLRPKIPRCCPKALAKLMKRCWTSDPSRRPNMVEVVSILEAIDTSKGRGMIPSNQRRGCFGLF